MMPLAGISLMLLQAPLSPANTSPANPPPAPAAAVVPAIATHASFGFRLRGEVWRTDKGGAGAASVRLCRLPGWAGTTVGNLRFELRHADGSLGESHVAHPPHLSFGLGENCAFGSARFAQALAPGDTLRICTPWKGSDECR